MRSHVLPTIAAGFLGTCVMLAPISVTAQPNDRERGWFGDRAEVFGEGRRGWFEERDRYERDAFERGYRQGRDDERRRAERARTGRDYGEGRNYRRGERERGDWNWFSGGDGLFD